MMVKTVGDNISMSEYNSLVYLLRKFKKLVKHETIDTLFKSDIGTFNVTSGFINVGENFILENDVNIISQNCLPLSTYSFTFYIVNTNTSETVIETPVTLSEDTDKYGNLEITIPEDLLSTGEEIKREIRIEVTFLENEGVSPTRLFNLDLTSDKKYITNGEYATVKATLHDTDDEPLANYTVYFEINGGLISRVTNSDGEVELNIYGSGENGVINIKVLNEEINIIDSYFIDNYNNDNWWNKARSWTTGLINKFKQIYLYSSDVSYFIASNIESTSSTIPFDDLVRIPTPFCVEFNTGKCGNSLDKIPFFVLLDSSGNNVFDLQLDRFNNYKIMVYGDVVKLWVNDVYSEYSINTYEYLYAGFWSNIIGSYIYFKDFMIYNLVEAEPPSHNYALSVSGNSIIESGSSASIVATLTDADTGVALGGETLSYQIKKDSTVLDSGSGVTNASGKLNIQYSASGVGEIDVIFSHNTFLQNIDEEINIKDVYYYDSLNGNKWWNMDRRWTTMIANNAKQIYLYSSDVSYFIASNIASTSSTIPFNDLVRIPTPFCVEFDTTRSPPTVERLPYFVLLDSNGNNVFDFQLTGNTHCKIMVYEDVVKLWVNDTYSEYSINTYEYLYAGFWSKVNTSYIYFKEFMIYNLG